MSWETTVTKAFMDERKLVYELVKALNALHDATNGIVSKTRIRDIATARSKARKALKRAAEQGFS